MLGTRRPNVQVAKIAVRVTQMSEQEAIAALKQDPRNETAFEVLHGLHRRRVYAICLRMIKNAAEAEDLCQEAFLQLFHKIHTYKGESRFSTWLHRITVNICLMKLRKNGLSTVSLEEYLEPVETGGPKRDVGAVDRSLRGLIDRVNLERAIKQLPPGYRLAFTLHEIEQYQHHEIAAMLDRSIGNSKSQLSKARRRLRELLRSRRKKL